MQYFEHAAWPAMWIKNAKGMVREEYDKFYLPKDDEAEEDADLYNGSARRNRHTSDEGDDLPQVRTYVMRSLCLN